MDRAEKTRWETMAHALHTVPTVMPESSLDAVDQILAKLLQWWNEGAAMVPNLVLALVIVGLTWLAARWVGKVMQRALDRTHFQPQIIGLFVSLTKLAVWGAGLVLALNTLHLSKAVATAIAGVGVIGLALGFAFQDIAANFMSGIIMAVRQPFAVGDVIETNGFVGTVTELGMRATMIRRFTGEVVMIPNRKVFSEPLTNVSAAKQRRVDLEVGVSYNDDLAEAERLVRTAVEGVADRDGSRPVEVFFKGFGASSIDLDVRFWVDYGADPGAFLRARSHAVMAIKAALDDGHITIPFPTHTLELGGSAIAQFDRAGSSPGAVVAPAEPAATDASTTAAAAAARAATRR